MDLKDYRTQLDAIDDQMASLFKQRMEIVRKVADYKKETNTPVMATGREREILYRVTGLCGEGERRFLYQKQKDGPILAPGGDYLCLYEAAEGSPWEWLVSRRARLQDYAAAHGWRLDARAYVEFSELTATGEAAEQGEPRVIRMRICEPVSPENADR